MAELAHGTAQRDLWRVLRRCWPNFRLQFGERWCGPSPLCRKRERRSDGSLSVWPDGRWHDSLAHRDGVGTVSLAQHLLQLPTRAAAVEFVADLLHTAPGGDAIRPAGRPATARGAALRKTAGLGASPRERAEALLALACAGAPKHRAVVEHPHERLPVTRG